MHFFLDPENAKAMVAVIAQSLATADSEHADIYRQNAAAETADLDDALIAAIDEPTEDELLIGLPVTLDGVRVGEVTDAELTGANQFVEAALDDGATVLLPLAAPYVSLGPQGVDLVDPPPGLLDPDA